MLAEGTGVTCCGEVGKSLLYIESSQIQMLIHSKQHIASFICTRKKKKKKKYFVPVALLEPDAQKGRCEASCVMHPHCR